MDLRVCLVATELFAWGRLGGFGAATRTIGGELAKKGVRVSVVVPAGKGQGRLEGLDGMEVHSFPLNRYPFTGSIYRSIGADIYHSEEPSWGTRLALKTVPGARHIATSQNPKTVGDWKLVEAHYPLRRRIYNRLVAPSIDVCVKQLDAVYCQARYIIPKTRAIYDLHADPDFLPNPVKIPKKPPTKSEEPIVCFLGRFDAEKRPETFFELAREFPEGRFVAAGKAHDEERDETLRRRCGSIRNLELPGFLDGAEKERLLSESWVLVNTSVSECLPVSFLEAAAHGCAILSPHDPDGFASNFGYHVVDGDYASGLRRLLDGNWRAAGEAGRRYVSATHEVGRVIDQHLEAYEGVLSTPRPSS
ncbi:MAG: glycosyltransferase family 4 protein [Candidatus Bathyarchaeota archaeon]|nr:glycosyltransferase family 4 protein [Candidatus Bathyarchaeota archaeon]